MPVRRRPPGRPPARATAHYLPKALRGTNAENRMRNYLALNPRNRPEEQYNAAKVFREGMGWIEWARAQQPFALVIDSFDAHEPWDAPRRLVDLYGPARSRRWHRADPAVRDAGAPRERHGSHEAHAPEDAPAVRGRGDPGGRVARPVPRPAGEPRAGREHAGRTGERPRCAAGRARLGGEALHRDARGAHPRADGDAAPRREGPRAVEQLLRLHPRHRPDGAVGARRERAARDERRRPVAALQRKAAAKEAHLPNVVVQQRT